MERMKPCPACGNSMVAAVKGPFQSFRIECRPILGGCGFHSDVFEDSAAAVAAWNKMIEELEDEGDKQAG